MGRGGNANPADTTVTSGGRSLQRGPADTAHDTLPSCRSVPTECPLCSGHAPQPKQPHRRTKGCALPAKPRPPLLREPPAPTYTHPFVFLSNFVFSIFLAALRSSSCPQTTIGRRIFIGTWRGEQPVEHGIGWLSFFDKGWDPRPASEPLRVRRTPPVWEREGSSALVKATAESQARGPRPDLRRGTLLGRRRGAGGGQIPVICTKPAVSPLPLSCVHVGSALSRHITVNTQRTPSPRPLHFLLPVSHPDSVRMADEMSSA
ncbi:hypothetical protein SKAU_G00120090 [Synaphobranchus kaupii]|uniref:Uncharacterized protein n=1 Tax=Synaphobranchus kaupii TaxID=118154 RepID=A0A9Q1FNJ4_SYNKA|nr:hypothetical protein SKAU_G00120090 [Synaphobranchus kaupii]